MRQAHDDLHTQLRALIEQLDEQKSQAVLQFIRALIVDPVWLATVTAPDDDEAYTDEERAAVRQALDELERGEGIGHEQVRQDLGL